jgi:hypothetical protein
MLGDFRRSYPRRAQRFQPSIEPLLAPTCRFRRSPKLRHRHFHDPPPDGCISGSSHNVHRFAALSWPAQLREVRHATDLSD